MTTVRFSTRASNQVFNAVQWYEREFPSLGRTFIDELHSMLQLLIATPEMYQITFDDIRRALLRRFPYAVFYRLKDSHIEVIAVLHHHIDPKTYQARS